MHGSRPDLIQLRQLILADVVITGLIGVIAGFILTIATNWLAELQFSRSTCMSTHITATLAPNRPPKLTHSCWNNSDRLFSERMKDGGTQPGPRPT
jgi:hypothetical protein